MLMIWIVVEADVIGFATSAQSTTVPLKPILMESMDNVEMRGEALSAEDLVKESENEFTILCTI